MVKLYEFYFKEQDKYAKMYGNKTIVFMQVGNFYEAYCTKTKGYTQLADLEPLLNIKYICRDNQENDKYDEKKSNQFGINVVAINKNINIMVENGYTIVIFNQTNSTTDDELVERVLFGVYSAGTNISDMQTNNVNNIMTVYLEDEKQLIHNKNLLAIGMTVVDILTGKSTIHEIYSKQEDDNYGLDELVRMIYYFKPIEAVIYYKPCDINEKKIENMKQYIELEKIKYCKFYIYNEGVSSDPLKLLTDDMFKINFQNNYLSKVYDVSKSKLSPLEILKLERKTYASISLLIMLKYIAEHNTLLIKNISFPEFYIHSEHLIIGNNAAEQLNIIDNNNLEISNKKFESVFQVINKTSTPMGKRLLRDNLSNPYSQKNKEKIIKRYDVIEKLIENNFYEKIQVHLKNISDIERLHRKMALGLLMPYELYRLHKYYISICDIYEIIKKSKTIVSIANADIFTNLNSFMTLYYEKINIKLASKYTDFNDISETFIFPGVDEKVDKIQNEINKIKNLIDTIKDFFIKTISKKKINKTDIVEIASNEKEGYYFTINKTNEKILKNALNNLGEISISTNNGVHIIKRNEIEFKSTKTRTKIFVLSIANVIYELSNKVAKLSKITKNVFNDLILIWYSEFGTNLIKISNFVAELDLLVSGAIVANEYSYCRPKILSNENKPSYVKIKALRHPIIERICKETEYIPNDIELGNVPHSVSIRDIHNNIFDVKKNGILLFGINWIGKSSLMKSIGIAVIMAQIGYFVSAESFEYEPYMALYARITGNDNIFKGLSSFALEMTELDAILIRTENHGENTLVIGDEVCRGTEDISGRSIVASAIISLSECNSSFIFSSHLHDIQHIDEIKKLNNLRLFHLSADFDTQSNSIIFDRKLHLGSGPSVYGLSVAQYIIKNKKFITRAENIKNRIISKDSILIPTKSSKYNSSKLVSKCQICGYKPCGEHYRDLETHHINFQRDCSSSGKINSKPYLDKNDKHNLVILCRQCHNKVHRYEIIINGYKDTTIGPLLDYYIDIKRKIKNDFQKLSNIL